MDFSNIKSDCSEKTTNDDSLERCISDNIAHYETIGIINLSSSGISNEGSTVSGGDLKLVSVDADEILVDCQNLFAVMMDEIEANNNKNYKCNE